MVYALTKQTVKNARESCLDFCNAQKISDNTGKYQIKLIKNV